MQGKTRGMLFVLLAVLLLVATSLPVTAMVGGIGGVSSFTGGDGSFKRVLREGIVIGIANDYPFTYQDEKTKEMDGLDVRVLVPNSLNDSQSVRYASQDSYEELLSGGVKIYEYQPAFIHTKSIIVDGIWSVVGSANMDNRSRKLNQEVVLGISDKGFGAMMENTFLGDLGRAEEIHLAEWTKRGVWQRVREKFDRNLVEQY